MALIRKGVKLTKLNQAEVALEKATAHGRDVDPTQLSMPEIFEHLALRRECTQPSSSPISEPTESDW
jgi:hypothetical protein